jgi:hypothetical protein
MRRLFGKSFEAIRVWSGLLAPMFFLIAGAGSILMSSSSRVLLGEVMLIAGGAGLIVTICLNNH